MIDLLLMALFILSYGSLCAVLALAGSMWNRFRSVRVFKTFLFFAYLNLLYFLSGLWFGLDVFVGGIGPVATLVFEILEKAATASLIYFLPATINYILGRRWTAFRLARVLFTAAFYLVSGLASLLTGNALVPGLSAVAAFLLIVLFVLVDASRNLPLVRDEVTRIAMFLQFGLTFLFLPLVQVLPLVSPGRERLLFFAGGLYYLMLGLTACIFFIRALASHGEDGGIPEDEAFRASCVEAGLTPRESEIASLIARGSTYKEIASELDISPNTVSNHVGTIYRKTHTRSKVEMVNALRKG